MDNIPSQGAAHQRMEWLDALRAYAIILVLIGHKTNNIYFEQVIYSFHVPLFFWISGFVFDHSRYPDLKSIIIKKFRVLLLPYFIFSFLSFAFWLVIVRSFSARGLALLLDPLVPFWGIFYGVGVEPWGNPINITLWFLPCLFVTDVLFWFVNNYFQNLTKIVVVAAIGIFGFFLSLLTTFRLPWSADVALVAMIFCYLGNMTRSFKQSLVTFPTVWKFSIMLLLVSLTLLFSKINGKADMNYNHYGNVFWFLIASFSGIYFSYLLFRMLPPSKILSYIGKSTIIIVGLVGIASFILHGLVFIIFRTLPSRTKLDLPFTLLFSFLEIVLIVPAIYFINKFVPFVIGREKNLKK